MDDDQCEYSFRLRGFVGWRHQPSLSRETLAIRERVRGLVLPVIKHEGGTWGFLHPDQLRGFPVLSGTTVLILRKWDDHIWTVWEVPAQGRPVSRLSAYDLGTASETAVDLATKRGGTGKVALVDEFCMANRIAYKRYLDDKRQKELMS